MTNEEIAVSLAKHKEEIGSLKHRMDEQEENNKTTQDLALSVRDLAVNMKNMMTGQQGGNDRLEALEAKDGEMWRKVVGYVVTLLIGAVFGYITKQIGM